jgi:predicted dehydrogenase
VAPERPYLNGAYAPFAWRGILDFGCGALGDMGCHIIDMPYWALELGWPSSVEAESEGNTAESGPVASTVTWRFPAGKYSGPLEYVWYDGGRMPAGEVIAEAGPTAKEVARRFDLVLIGEKGKFFFSRSHENWLFSPAGLAGQAGDVARSVPRVKSEDHEWLSACQGGPPALSNFDYAARLTEMVLLGNVAIRAGQKIEWDGPNMRAVNCPEAEPWIRREYRPGW